ncbi:YhgE/Pip domain-containing protein [Clostridium fermenticellae]|uniref:YhgE/Pip domain-containing protein n=1 Tax=Clostridium fermenticellae TaxID=2068654 RepID=A0A386H368_9CLOT|nr:YhgE/Pip domain-containing protein [Clostridium fermenticellae]AYD40116.1 YhgE/Pip domain-containing protein [Clostridium fermenticellae]
MKNIFRIFKRDLKNIFTNYVAIIIITALIILPSLYAWFNIAASWDPYSNTKNLSVAIVNLDQGSEFKNIKINVGKDVIAKLKNDQNIGWRFVSSEDAKKGVKTGKYYASITITKDFSKNLLSIINGNVIKKSELIYSVNEKINAIAPKITKNGATALEDEITRNFIQTCSDTVFSYLNQFGVELEHIKPQLQNIADIIMDMDKGMPKVGNYIDTAYTSSILFKQFLGDVQKNVSVVSDGLNKTVDIAEKSNNFMKKSKSSLEMIPSWIKSDLNSMKDSINNALDILKDIKPLIDNNQSEMRKKLVIIVDTCDSMIKKIDNNIELLNSINNYADSEIISNFIGRLSDLKNKFIDEESKLNKIIGYIDDGKEVSDEEINSILNEANEISNLATFINNDFSEDTFYRIESILEDISGLSSDGIEILQNAQKNIPTINSLIINAENGTNMGSNILKDIKDRFPEAAKHVHSDAEKIKNLTEDRRLNEVINIMERNAKMESDFLANPVEMKQERIYPIPNYGSAMAPFYTVLAIWVGAFILLSILSVGVNDFSNGIKVTPLESFFGRYLTFASITIMQALVVTLGNLFILKTYVLHPFWYVIYGIFVSIVFIMIVYTLVSVFGNIGKAITMIALVLQVSASGGTFPVELMSSFFRYINPLLPFTYAIGGMRELIGGILESTLIRDVTILCIYFLLALFMGIFFKEKINKLNKKFVKMFKQSGLVE